MDFEALVLAVTQKVVHQLQNPAAHLRVMVLGARDAHLAERVHAALGEDAELLFFAEATDGAAADRYILPVLSCSAMADLASGRASDAVHAEVLRLLLSGHAVETLEFAYKSYSETAPGALYALYASYEKTLASYGLTACKAKQPDTFRFREHLVTESVVNTARENGASVLLVPAEAIVTPLAAEAAGNLHINILKRL